MHLLLPLDIDTGYDTAYSGILLNKLYGSIGCATSLQGQAYTGWAEIHESIEIQKKRDLHSTTVGLGLGWLLNPHQAFKLYCYRDLSVVFLRRGARPLKKSNLCYTSFTDGFEIQATQYRVSINYNKNNIFSGHNNYRLFDLVDVPDLGWNAKVQWNYLNNLIPYLGAYYDHYVQIPIVNSQYYSVNYNEPRKTK